MKGRILLASVLLSLIPLAMMTSAISASQLGATSILGSSDSANWAGVLYSVEWKSWFTNYWAPISYVSEDIYVGNLSVGYAGYTNPNVVGIWVGLSPCKMGTGTDSNSPSQVSQNFIQAGYGIFVNSQNEVSIQYFVQTWVNGQIVYNNAEYVPAGRPTYLYVYLQDFNNGTAMAQFNVYYANGSYWSTRIYTSWPWSEQEAGTAMTIVEAPTTPLGYYAEIPYLDGGMIQFDFGYSYNGNLYAGPGYAPSGTTMWAYVYNLVPSYSDNAAGASIVNGWSSPGGWEYLYKFNYSNGLTLYGL